MEVTRFIHPQVSINRQSEDYLPGRVQLFLCIPGSTDSFLREQCLCSRDKRLDASVNPIQDRLIQVHDVHTALTDWAVLFPDKDMISVKEHSELVVGVRIGELHALTLLLHMVHLCTR